MEFEWDPQKDRANQEKHGISFDQAKTLFTGYAAGRDYLEIYDAAHSGPDEDRFVALGRSDVGLICVAFTERPGDVIRIISARAPEPSERAQITQYIASQVKP